MLDPHLLRESTEEVSQKLALRGFEFNVSEFQALESERKSLQVETQRLQSLRNERSKAIGHAKAHGEDIEPMRLEVTQISAALEKIKADLNFVLEQISQISLSLPNIPHESVHSGRDENDNLEIRRWGTPKSFEFEVQSHDALGEQLGMMNFEMAAKITGSRFVVMSSDIAKLHRALAQFMLNTHTTQHGYEEIYVPYIVNADSLHGTGQLPKFEEDLFKLTGEQSYYLTSTAEIPVTNTVRNTIQDGADLPLKYACHSPCFRSEAGSYGRDTKGMIRQHQFEKVELVWVTKPEDSYDALEQLTSHAEEILKQLNLPYRVVSLCTGDMGAGAAKTYDLEVWLPSQNTYREISSCSNMESFQARRMQARYKEKSSKETTLVHTLNGSGLAVGRTLVALLENYQDENGHIHIPDVLQPYMGGQQVITKRNKKSKGE